MRILVTDLDGTLLGGERADRRRLHAALARHPEVVVVFATGRGPSSVREVLRDPLVPRPRWIIADVGASVVDGADLTPVEAIQRGLRSGWPGARRVREALRGLPGLTYQHGVSQSGRCSFHLRPEHLTHEITDAVQALGCTWLYSADRYFDVLPRGASKGNALAALAAEQHWPMDSVLVAGDSLNDLSLFGLGARGVIVGNAEPALLEAVPEDAGVHRPDRPGAAGILSALQDLGWVEREHPLVIGYHRPPVHWTRDGWRAPASPNGILPTLRSLFTANPQALWATAAVLEPEAPPADLERHDTGLPLSFVPLSPAQWAGYFHQACKETLWPVLMSQPERVRFDPEAWGRYREVNARFADHISARAAPGATVWLHDYNLWLVPGLLRPTRPDLRVGLFHHTPFPPPEVFATLPSAPEILASLSCLDWAGFHTEAFAGHFRRLLADAPRPPRVGVHPLGIDRAAIETLARARRPRAEPTDGLLVLSVERLDYAKAPVQKVEAVAALLARRPELRGRLRFRLVCPPPEAGITSHEATRRRLEHRIGEVNRAWGAAGWQPIEYLPRSLPFAEVIDHYLAADVFWVTSLQDGMNLTAKEYIAAQHAAGRSGVLVLSRHTGAAVGLGSAALLTDPRSPADLVDTLHRALTLAPDERRIRLERLADLLGHHHPAHWAADITTAIRHGASKVLHVV
ncbi:trehalose-6-phosphate synthase/hydroxymethylpyrimidine pyrophosphatase-like HAD family hydrolase [Kitasatospora sp. MAA4]|uniref:trehalose-6-phosphate synthase n=1 Tax=Kitasatospora sp. MAA4 TaxID=3035093 RepID=UPI00247403B2|nr:trehalose-6-phosphate synthase [Kitasatospora sp. MAA4]MDH6136843.1 trehalose-6-phosphate synthase/hydroxymethylpyrimidine pyrophosphatase-like HAD family hydrolase [Kitasatospora sp. MAA4]